MCWAFGGGYEAPRPPTQHTGRGARGGHKGGKSGLEVEEPETLTSLPSSQRPTPAATGRWACGAAADAPGRSSPSPASSAGTPTAPGPSWTASCRPSQPARRGGPAPPRTQAVRAPASPPCPRCSRSHKEGTGRRERGQLTRRLRREAIPGLPLKLHPVSVLYAPSPQSPLYFRLRSSNQNQRL